MTPYSAHYEAQTNTQAAAFTKSAESKAEAVSTTLAKRAADAIHMKKGKDVAAVFAFASTLVAAKTYEERDDAIARFVGDYKL